jgi:hypothetical protein
MRITQLRGLALAIFAIAACSTAPTTESDKAAQGAEVEVTIAKFKKA